MASTIPPSLPLLLILTSLPLLTPLLLGGAVGAVAGQRLAPHLSDRHLRRGFFFLLVASALLTGAEAWKRQAPLAEPSAAALSQRNARP